jgi:hypothetical protein
MIVKNSTQINTLKESPQISGPIGEKDLKSKMSILIEQLFCCGIITGIVGNIWSRADRGGGWIVWIAIAEPVWKYLYPPISGGLGVL